MNAKPLLLVSILINVLLTAAIIYRLATPPAAESSRIPVPPAPVPATNSPSPRSQNESTNAVKQFTWELVESEDYRKYIANLRAIGCPEETIHDIIIADVNKLFESRRAKLRTTRKRFEYWKASSMMTAMGDEEGLKQKQELNREKRELLKELLGVAPEEKPDVNTLLSPLETMLDFLPSSKQSEVLETMQRYQAKIMKAISNGAPDAEDQKKMMALQKEMESEISRLMTPQQFEDYQLRMSQTSMMMRMQLAVFDPSEQEFKEIFKLRKTFDDEFPVLGYGGADAAERDRRTKAQTELDSKLKNLLGEERFTEYQRGQDFNYQAIAKTADRFNLPKDSAVKVYDMKQIAEEQVKRVRSDSKLSPAQREAALQAIQAETERSVREVFGEQAFNSYEKQQGFWIKNLAPSRPPAPQPTPVP